MFRFSCHPDGGESFEVVARSRAITAWETAPGQPKGAQRSIGDFTSNLQMKEAVDLAWFAASQAGQTGLDIKQWREQVDIEFEPYGDDETGPTQPAP
jgi:hypothetical protein